MKRKTRSLVAVALALLVAPPVIYGTALWRSRRPAMSLEELLAANPAFPQSWATGDVAVQAVDWRVTGEDNTLVPNFASQAEAGLTRTWRANSQEGEPEIAVGIFRYNNPIMAAAQSWLSRPEAYYSDRCINFGAAGRDEDRYPRSWTPSNFADAELAACGIGRPDSCAFWIYRARYGQYLLNIEFWAPNRGMSSEVFLRVVKEIDEHLQERLSSQRGGR
jgi:hypothetical protein